MSIEKIAEIKNKRLSKKRTTTVDITGPDDIEMQQDLRTMLEYDVEQTADIIARERQWRNRTTILQSTGKQFKDINAMLSSVKAKEEGKVIKYVLLLS